MQIKNLKFEICILQFAIRNSPKHLLDQRRRLGAIFPGADPRSQLAEKGNRLEKLCPTYPVGESLPVTKNAKND
jgi:hypothetical protein